MGLRIFEKRAVDRDPAARQFETIIVPHLPDALAFARWLTGSSHDAEDVVQEASLRAFKGIHTFDGRNARAWLLSIVRNSCFTWLAKNRPKELVFVGASAELEETETPADPQPDAEEILIAAADQQRVAAALAALPLLYREAVVLHDINGMSYKDMASLLEVPIGTVMSRLARGRARLASQLQRTAS